jgi:transposase-like zinc-binding protein/putative transposase
MNNPKPVNKIEVADILRLFSENYTKTHLLPYSANKVIRNIVNCRTALFGGHKQACDECSHTHISYNSCGDRHCPKCGMLAKEKWLGARKEELLPVPYYHIVFTLPDLLNPLALNNPQALYGILFKAAKETLIKLGKDPKHIGAEIGLIAVLHTWGQNLSFHPHLHVIVPGGGLSDGGKQWRYPKKSKKNKKFFVHVSVISDLFKKIFLYYLKQEHKRGKLKGLQSNEVFNSMINNL